MRLLDEFYERKSEVTSYLQALKLAERLLNPKTRKNRDHQERIFRSGALLILYNLIEASARNGIKSIYDEIKIEAINFEELNHNIQHRILKDFKSQGSSKHIHSDLARELIQRSFVEKKLFSGNVNSEEIGNQARDFGFNHQTEYNITNHGSELETVRLLRNDLAHGNKSFSEASKNLSIKDIEQIFIFSSNYMEQILKNIQLYIKNKEYLEKYQAT